MTDDTNSGVVTKDDSVAPDGPSRNDWISKLLHKEASTDQLPDRNVGITIGGGLKPPYDPYLLAGLTETNGTHATCVTKKARRACGFGIELEPYGDLSEEDASDEEYERAHEFWFGSGTKWKLGPTGSTHATPAEIFEKADQDHHAIGWDAIEIIYSGADTEPQGLSYVPAKSVRIREADDGGGPGHGFVQKRDGRTVFFGEAGDRHTAGDGANDEEVYVDKHTGDVFRGDGTNLPEDFTPANELLFYPSWHPNATNGYGIPNWIAETQTIINDNHARRVNGNRLKNGLQIDYVVVVEGGQLTETTRSNMGEWFEEMRESDKPELLYLEAEELSETGNLNGAGGGDISIRLEPAQHFNEEDETFSELRDRNMRDIARAHEVPIPALGEHDATNTNTREALRELDEEVIGPNQARREERIYRAIHQQALDVHDWKLSFKKGEIRDEQAETEMAAVVIDSVGEGLTVSQALELFPVDVEPDDSIGDMLLSEATAEPALMQALEDEVGGIATDAVNGELSAHRITVGGDAAEVDD